MAISTLIKHIHYKLANESAQGVKGARTWEQRIKAVEEMREMLGRMGMMVDMIDRG
jgi:hypothetical protein